MKVPEIDKRNYDEIVAQTEALVQAFTSEVRPTFEALNGRILNQDITIPDTDEIITAGTYIKNDLAKQISQIQGLNLVKVKHWQASENHDAGAALIRIFARMTQLAIARLNKVPEKNFLTFLDLIGIQIQPPQPARVPLTFNLAVGSPLDAFVPAQTQVIAPPTESQLEEIIFETDQDLVVTPSQLTTVFVRDPLSDRYGDYTQAAQGLAEQSFPAFSGDRSIVHSLYLANDELFLLPDKKTITLLISSSNTDQLSRMPISWYYWDSNNIIQGLVIKFNFDTKKTEVLPGTAIDAQGRKIELLSIETLNLNKYTNQIVFIAISYGEKNPLISVFPEAEASNYQPEIYIRLAHLAINSEGDISNLVTSLITENNQWQVSFTNFPIPTERTINGVKAAWLEARLNTSLLPNDQLPKINHISVKVNIQHNDLAPDFGFINFFALDLSKDFYPFGTQPVFNDTLYLASQKAFANPGGKVTLNVKLSEFSPLPINPTADLEIVWEVWNGRVWQPVGNSAPHNSSSNSGFIDTTQAFTKSGKIEFTLPSKVALQIVNGQSNYWIRARIIKGSYGTGIALDQQFTITTLSENSQETDPNQKKIIKVNSVRGFLPGDRIQIAFSGNNQEDAEIESIILAESKFILRAALTHDHAIGASVVLGSNLASSPPSIASLTLNYEYERSSAVSACQTYNDYTYIDCTATANQLDSSDFEPFTLTADKQPTLYLGFDQPFSNRAIRLYVGLEPLLYQAEKSSNPQNLTKKPDPISWEYSSFSGWIPLQFQDETHAFTRKGLITFTGLQDIQPCTEFGRSLYWLRAYRKQEQPSLPTSVRHLLLNTTWATQVITIENEILGSSNNQKNQVFRTTKIPVLEGQHLEVLEPQMPSPKEQSKITELEGKNAIAPILGFAGELEGVWVRWHQVPNFKVSDTWDRHYILDHLTGEVRFGDDQNGMIPPQGRHNIRITYRAGGGESGNCPAKTIVQLKSAVPYIDSVINYESAGGGADAETLNAVKERGPKTLRHRGRAVTAQDFEDLAKEASPAVAKAKAVTPSQKNGIGVVELLVVPHSQKPQPIPSLNLLENVANYIRDRCAPTLELQTYGPDWIAISVKVEIIPVSLAMSMNLEGTIVKVLQDFLHPVTGGWEKLGWDFGRKPHKSDFYRLLESIDGVECVTTISIEENPKSKQLIPARCLVFCGNHSITVISPLPEEA
ncbi:MAG: putative baseplate assembly protein [Nostoc sp. CmiVER01]|uniref:putative baseplate assembly protein n=1 Tax=Nostoc sp. CmiVER01 TaxID=3075384 RepID=UPI002AD38780|nr:putative baseplate assembly protein [Nostoc sp. CmiVER01]MDZ8124260.1 putative baseplate assembly protein [Nostoc sp. CmiVER01]